ncbi:MAG: 1-acyl-sn-glycerol-3-phosphate acyltransferase [Pseudomonadales bacterium]|nr:1-acyl-sn-glycerol-3-phosphate acyltransferase [Pseudomonadales bacterium]
MIDFEDIRPYHDSEVSLVLQGLLGGNELARALAKFRFPGLFRIFPGIFSRLVNGMLRRELKDVRDVRGVQVIIEKYLDKAIETTTTGLTHTGLDGLDPAKSHLFISNHRDITMDPALVNYMLYHEGFDTVQIATGDNLMKRPLLADLMRLNKSFIVKRSLHGREKLRASQQLSAYIHYCIDHGQSVWIAQREGRAKDGVDKTESAIIKMLHMADRGGADGLTLGASMNALNIVPVAISYECDPCDLFKAEELHAIATTGKFVKDANSDVSSILNGMIGNKGHVHVTFGEPLTFTEDASAEIVAETIDAQINANYKLHPINYFALEKIRGDRLDLARLGEILAVDEAQLLRKQQECMRRVEACPPAWRPFLLKMYANPLLRQMESGFARYPVLEEPGANALLPPVAGKAYKEQ